MKLVPVAATLAACLSAGCASVGGGWGSLPEQYARIARGQAAAEVRTALGRPAQAPWLRREGRLAWGYKYNGFYQYRMFWVEFAADGTVAAVSDERDFAPPSFYPAR